MRKRQAKRRRLGLERLEERRLLAVAGANLTVGEETRTLRLAVTTTGEYIQHFGSQQAALAAVEETVALANEILLRELSVRLDLVSAPQLIFADPATDPYVSGDGDQLYHQSHETITATIGTSSFDIGHLFNQRKYGAVYGFNTAGDPDRKGKAVTAAADPQPAEILKLFLHVIGHQLGAPHSLNSAAAGCAGSRNPSAAYEPGAGSTIMALPPLCGADSYGDRLDLYFHADSFDRIESNLRNNPRLAGVATEPSGNSPPVVDAGPDFVIPAGTPYGLVGSATDSDGDQLRYSWEQMDLGPARSLADGDGGSGPLVRSQYPTPDPVRTFPRFSDFATGRQTIAEPLPTTTRMLNFRLPGAA